MKCVKVLVSLVLACVMVYFLTRNTYEVHDPAQSAVVVTGASTGLGRHAAEFLAVRGFTVFAGYRSPRHRAELEALDTDLIVPLKLDVRNTKEVSAAVATVTAECEKRGVKLMGLVNNAGVAIAKSMAQLEFQYGVNVFGLIDVTNQFLPLLTANPNGGRLVIIGSLGALYTPPNHALYTGTKAALEAIADGLRREHDILFPGRLSVSILETGAINTAILGKMTSLLHDHHADLVAACDDDMTSDDCRYALMTKAFEELAHESPADIPQTNSDAVTHALTSPHPRPRYLVGMDAQFMGRIVRIAPDCVLDWLTKKIYQRKIAAIEARMQGASAAEEREGASEL